MCVITDKMDKDCLSIQGKGHKNKVITEWMWGSAHFITLCTSLYSHRVMQDASNPSCSYLKVGKGIDSSSLIKPCASYRNSGILFFVFLPSESHGYISCAETCNVQRKTSDEWSRSPVYWQGCDVCINIYININMFFCTNYHSHSYQPGIVCPL